MQQECGADGEARHDLVLYSTGKKKFRIELKGDAPYTKRQLRALKMGSKAPEDIRIDVLILPKWMPPPAQTAPSVRIVTWAQVDKEVLGRKGIGNLESLWLGTQRFPKACLTADARRYIAFMRGQVTGTTWRSLWQSLDYLKGSLSMDLGFGRCAGPKQAKTWYYGVQAYCENGDARWWLTWVFEGGRAGRLKMALALMDRDGAAPPSLRRPLPSWAFNDCQGVLLADLCDSDDDTIINLPEIAEQIRTAVRPQRRRPV